MDGQLVLDWDRLENFFKTRDQPIDLLTKSQMQNAKVEYHMCKHSQCTIALVSDARTDRGQGHSDKVSGMPWLWRNS